MTPKGTDAVGAKSTLQAPRGMHDLLPEAAPWYRHVTRTASAVAEYYGFTYVETPMLEDAALFRRAIGEATDVVSKEMYSVRAGSESLALRPEGTVGIMRAYLEHGMHTLPQPVMLYTHGVFFRHEKPQAGRLREFRQFDIEILGEANPVADATVIQVFYRTLADLGFKNVSVKINSLGDLEHRATYRRHLVAFYKKHFRSLSKDERARLAKNPLRLLDSKEPHLIEINREAPAMIEFLSGPAKKSFRDVLEFLDAAEIPYELDDHLVRGLDYYTHTVFEIFVGTGGDNETIGHLAVGGGGRYDGLAALVGRHPVPAVGAAFGIDRIVELARARTMALPKEARPQVFFIHLGALAAYQSLQVMEILRGAGIHAAQSIGSDSLRDQLAVALKRNIQYALILGQKEAMEKTIIIQDLETRSQETVPINDLAKSIKQRLRSERAHA